MGLTIITSLIAILAIAFTLRGIKIVQQSETVILERLGKYHSTLTSGLNIIIPFLDKPRQIIWRYSTEGPMGNTIVKYVKELRDCPNKEVHMPSNPEGLGYVEPIVDLKISRQKAIDVFGNIKKEN